MAQATEYQSLVVHQISNPHPNGWAVSLEVMKRLDREGRLFFPAKEDERLRKKIYLDESPGVPLTDVWDDLPPIHASAPERLGYPTQKPLSLLKRIINTSSNESDVVLDPFCRCGTAIEAAQKLNRRWIGIDITQPAMVVVKRRLNRLGASNYEVIGEPVSVPDAEALAEQDPYQFQWWSLGLVGARPTEGKKGADRGVDGRLLFHDGRNETKEIIFSVKAGKLHASYVRDLRGVIEREKAQIGVLISFESPTKQMIAEAASAGVYTSPWGRRTYPRIQLLTVTELMSGTPVKYPGAEGREDRTFRKGAAREPSRRRDKQATLFS
jgi:site-specific DNA-methyltransferase (adenine-specific)